MGLASKLRRQEAIRNQLQDDKEWGLLRKRRDKVNPAGVFIKKESAEFRTAVGAKQKSKGSSKTPGGWYKQGQFA